MRTGLLYRTIRASALATAIVSAAGSMFAQAIPGGAAPAAKIVPAAPVLPPQVELPPGYVIGAEDVLAIVFWREKDLSVGEATVRPDGKITLPLLNDLRAAGLTPDELRAQIQAAANKYVTDPTVTVVVQTIRSRKVFITGQVAKPGQYPLMGPTTVMQLIAMAGGVHEFADKENILIMRTEGGRPIARRFNYDQVLNRRNLNQNIELLPGDTIVVP
jgi:polysaccharide export outer membrane protein